MTEPEREKLVADIGGYLAMMAPHQKSRMGGQLILRAYEALKSMRILEGPLLTESAHRTMLLEDEIVAATKKWDRAMIEWQKELFIASRKASMEKNGPDNPGPGTGGNPDSD